MYIKDILTLLESKREIKVSLRDFTTIINTVIKEFGEKYISLFDEIIKNNTYKLTAGVEITGLQINEGRDSLRLNILSKAFDKIKFKQVVVKDLSASYRKKILNSLIKHKEDLKVKTEVKDIISQEIRKQLNNAIDKVFKMSILSPVVNDPSNSNKEIFYIVRNALKNALSQEVINSKMYKVNTDKRLKESDLTFLGELGGVIKKHPNGSGYFPDYQYTFPKEEDSFEEGDFRLINEFLKTSTPSILGKTIFIESKGDKGTRIVSSQTGTDSFTNKIGKVADELSELKVNEAVRISLKDTKKILKSVNILHKQPVLYVKVVRGEVYKLNFEDLLTDPMIFIRMKSGISIQNQKKEKIFTLEFTSGARREFFKN